VRALLASFCCFTIAASAWLATMAFVSDRPGHLALSALAFLFVLQSLVTIGFTSGRFVGAGMRLVLAAGATGILGQGGRAVAANVTRAHFEGYAFVIGLALVVQGLLTLWSVYTRRSPTLGRTAPIW
jgi:hypothetical protein